MQNYAGISVGRYLIQREDCPDEKLELEEVEALAEQIEQEK